MAQPELQRRHCRCCHLVTLRYLCRQRTYRTMSGWTLLLAELTQVLRLHRFQALPLHLIQALPSYSATPGTERASSVSCWRNVASGICAYGCDCSLLDMPRFYPLVLHRLSAGNGAAGSILALADPFYSGCGSAADHHCDRGPQWRPPPATEGGESVNTELSSGPNGDHHRL